MSDRARSDIGPFAIVPDWLLRSAVSDRALRLFALLARYADRDMEAFPSRSTLAADLNTSRDSIDRAVKELIAIGAVRVEHRHDPSGDLTSNLYQITFAAPGNVGVVAATMRPPTITGAATVAAPVRHRTITTVTRSPVSEETGGDTAPPVGAVLPYDRPRRSPRGGLLRGPDPTCYRDGPGPLGVPQKQHQDFLELRTARGMVYADAVRELDSFYERWTMAYTEGERRGWNMETDRFRFWRARHDETWPATVPHGRTGEGVAGGPAVPGVEATRELLRTLEA